MKKIKDSNYYDKMSDRTIAAAVVCEIFAIGASAAKKNALAMGLAASGYALAVVADNFLTKQKQEILNEINRIEKRDIVKPIAPKIDIIEKAEEAMNEMRKMNEAKKKNLEFIREHFDNLSTDDDDDDNHEWQA